MADGTTIAVDLKAGRGDNGFTATLDIIPTKVKAIQGNMKMPAAEAKAAEEAAVAITKQTADAMADKIASHITARIQEDAADAVAFGIASGAVTATSVHDSAAPKAVTKVGLFSKPAVDTSAVDELVNEEPTYSTDADALDPAEAPQEEAPKPTGKSIFSRVS